MLDERRHGSDIAASRDAIKHPVGPPARPWHFAGMSDPDDLPLAADFPASTHEAWRKLAEGVLKGAPWEKLVARTSDGITIEPLYSRKGQARPVIGRTPGTAWQVVQRVDHPDPAAANTEALHDLENGATGLALVLSGATGARGFGLAPSDLARALDGVHLDAGIALDVDCGPQGRDAARELAALVERRGLAPSAVDIRFGLDPIGAAARAGGSSRAWPDTQADLTAVVADLAHRGYRGPFVVADGRIIHDAGGSEAQELAWVLAVALQYLRALEAGGHSLDAARRMVAFRLAADADQFLTLAKYRALRRTWARVETACGLAPTTPLVAAETAWRMTTRHDPYVNMLRATIAVAAAGLGGADAITVLPFTAARGLPDRFARRIARNTQLVLLEESHLAKVADPTAGAGGIEDITQQLCLAAWSRLQEIERAGGAWTALAQGLLQRQVATVRAEREKAVARRKDALIGTSEFPDLAETPVRVLDVAPVEPPRPELAVTFEALPCRRLAEPFEQLRDASDLVLARSGVRPRIFLANLGRPADFNARAAFAKSLFEAGGIEAVSNDGFTDRAEMAAAFRRSGAQLACLCSSDDIYAREAVTAARALQGAGAVLWLAGRPGPLEAELKAAGVQLFVHVGSDALEILQAGYRAIGLAV